MGDPCWKKNGRQNNYDMMSLRKKETLTLLDRLRLFLGYNPLAHADQRRMGPGVACRQVVIMAVEVRRGRSRLETRKTVNCWNCLKKMLRSLDKIGWKSGKKGREMEGRTLEKMIRWSLQFRS